MTALPRYASQHRQQVAKQLLDNIKEYEQSSEDQVLIEQAVLIERSLFKHVTSGQLTFDKEDFYDFDQQEKYGILQREFLTHIARIKKPVQLKTLNEFLNPDAVLNGEENLYESAYRNAILYGQAAIIFALGMATGYVICLLH